MIKKTIMFLMMFFLLGNLITCSGKVNNTQVKLIEVNFPEEKTISYWESATPESQGMNSERLIDMIKEIGKKGLEYNSISIIKNGKLILDSYIYPYNRDTIHNVKSVSKSILSALVGIALREGFISNLNEKVYDYFPEYFPEGGDERKKEITLHHLLTMSAGLDVDEDGPSDLKILSSDNWIKSALEQDMKTYPGKYFVYSTVYTHIMSGILTKSTGMSLKDLAEKYIFKHLEIEDMEWLKDPQGYYYGGAELFLKPLDIAKFGYLFLNNGKWENKQIIPEEWVNKSTSNLINVDKTSTIGYGYWWWINFESSKIDTYSALGWGGQAIYVIPEHNMVCVFTSSGNHFAPSSLMDKYIIPAIQSDKELPPNPKKVEELNSLIYKLKYPDANNEIFIPRKAKEISGIRYNFEQNYTGFHSISFDFDNSSVGKIIVENDDGTYDLEIGLDDIYRVSEVGIFKVFFHLYSKAAAKGKWITNDELRLYYHEIGNPFNFEFIVKLKDKNSIEITIKLLPNNFTIKLYGKTNK